jgi:hypothetical protein
MGAPDAVTKGIEICGSRPVPAIAFIDKVRRASCPSSARWSVLWE